MRQRWMSERDIKQQYGDRILTIGFENSYLAALSEGTYHSFWALGGDFQLKPEELEKKVIDAYLAGVGDFKDTALKFCMAGKNPLVLTDEGKGTQVPFKYIIGLNHTYGIGHYGGDDIGKLRAVASAVPEFREGIYLANFLPLASPGVMPQLDSVLYQESIVGNLRAPKNVKGTIEFIRIVSRRPSPA